jgi:peptidoglycan/LPS O-acetylase OafA/YrhL
MTGSSAAPAGSRIGALDAMRGIACLLVVLHHLWQTLPDAATAPWAGLLGFGLGMTPLEALRTGRAPVMFFFVLSGYVLSLPLLRGGGGGYPVYALRRICRIWLPFAAAVLFSALLLRLVGNAPVEASRWFHQESWTEAPSAAGILAHLLMLGTADAVGLNNVMWSLVHELRISLVFPLVVLAARLPLLPTSALMVGIQLGADAALLAGGHPLRPYHGTDLAHSFLITAHFLPAFLLGAVLARHGALLLGRLDALPRIVRLLLWPGALSMLTFRVDAVSSAGAGLLILLVLRSAAAQRGLTTRPLDWLGRVSFSLYLIHLPLLLVGVRLFSGLLPLPAILGGVFILALIAAEAMHRWVETPSIALGRWLAARPASTPPSLAAGLPAMRALLPDHTPILRTRRP